MPQIYISQHTNVIPSSRGTAILFHSVSGHIDEVELALGEALLRQENTVFCPQNPCDAYQWDYLEQRGYITQLPPEEELTEFRGYVETLHLEQQKTLRGAISLLPSYLCNLSCPYCFQNDISNKVEISGRSVMSTELVDLIFDKTIPLLFPSGKNPSTVSLFGGEPLLPATKTTVKRILERAGDIGATTGVVTNGTYVDQFVESFGTQPGEISVAHITIDGPAPLHNISRCTRGGDPTFEKIIGNTQILLDLGVQVVLTYNATSETAPYYKNIKTMLLEEGFLEKDNFKLNAKRVDYVPGKGLDKEYSDFNLLNDIAELGGSENLETFPELKQIESLFSPLPKHISKKTAYCTMVQGNNLWIDSFMDIYSCPVHTGQPEKRIGKIDKNGLPVFNQLREACQARTIVNIDQCKSCSISLLCGGGCAVKAEKKNGTIFTAYCNSIKEILYKQISALHMKYCSPNQYYNNFIG